MHAKNSKASAKVTKRNLALNVPTKERSEKDKTIQDLEFAVNVNQFKQDRFGKLLMVPHSEIWEIFVIFVIVIQNEINIISLTYLSTKPDIVADDVLHYCGEMVVFIDMVFIILHRNFSTHKVDLCTKKDPFLIVIIMIVSLLPYYEVYVYLLLKPANNYLQNYVKIKTTLRLIKVLLFFGTRRKQSGVEQVVVIFFNSLFLFTMFLIGASSLWSWLGCYNCTNINWTVNLRDFDYNEDSLVDQILYPVTFIGSLISGNYEGVLKGENSMEYIVMIVTMLAALVIRGMLFVSQTVAQYIWLNRKQSTFNSRLENIYRYIEKQEFTRELNNDIKVFYDELWHKRRAICGMPHCFKLLPLALQKEVVLDIFWDAFQHSHFFKDITMTFKRELSLIMESKFLLAGDYLYDTEQMKTSMVYIVSGIVQILSDEDDESPVVSFSSGTVLGEICCLMPNKCECRMRCATYCEFIYLSLPTFAKKLLVYHDYSKVFWDMIRERVTFAKYMQRNRAESGYDQKSQIKSIRRIKVQWRAMKNEEMPRNINYFATSKYLDLLVLSDEMDLKVEVICLTSTFPFILDPNSSFRHFCDIFCLGAAIIQFLIIPLCAAFQRKITNTTRTVLLIMDFIYVFDIALQTTTAIKDKTVIVSFSQILLRRVQKLSFVIDLVATFPYDYIALAFGCTDHQFVLCKVPRILKVYKILSLIKKHERKLGKTSGIMKFIKYYVILLIMTYIATCCMYLMACYHEECYVHSWYAYNNFLLKWDMYYRDHHPAVKTLFVVTGLLHGAGSGGNFAYNVQDATLMFVVCLFGYYLLCFAMSELTSAEYWAMHEERSHTILVTTVMNFTRLEKISDHLMFRVSNMLRFRWKYNRDLVKCDATQIFGELTTNLRERITYQLITKYLQSATFFQNMDDEFIRQVAGISKVILYPPNSYLTISDQIIAHIYIIKRGYCVCESRVPGDLERGTSVRLITSGECFPIMEVLHQINTFITVKAITTVEAIVIPYENMIYLLKINIKSYEELTAGLLVHMNENKSILQRSPCRMTFRMAKPTRVFGDLFTYNAHNYKPTDIKSFSMFHIFMKTFDSSSKFFKFYEVVRCILSVVQFFNVIFYINIFYNYRNQVDIVNYVLELSCWIDMYLKTCMHYYNDHGIPVTDRKSITKHYIRTSFLVDLFSSFPFKLFSFTYFVAESDRLIMHISIMLISRPLQLYRLFFGLDYAFRRSKQISDMIVVRVKLILLLFIMLFITANIIQLICCDIMAHEIICSTGPLYGGQIREVTRNNALVIYTYVSAQYLSRFCYMIFAMRSTNSVVMFYVMLAFIYIVLSQFFFSKLASSGLHEEYMTSQLQNNRKNFETFAKGESMDDSLTRTTLKTNEYLTRNLTEFALAMAETRFTPQLLNDFSHAIHYHALTNCKLFKNAEQNFIRFFSAKVNRLFIMKDGIIIRYNDVHNNLYIVKSGSVEISVANTRLANLGYGGMFGCFTEHGMTRQTIMAKATLHTEILSIKSEEFHKAIAVAPLVKRRVATFLRGSPEYIEGEGNQARDVEISLMSQTILNMPKYQRFVNQIFAQAGPCFKVCQFLIDVHLATWSSIFVLMYELYVINAHPPYGFTVLFYCLDAFFALRIVLGFSGLTYVDEQSGLVVTQYSKIVKKYLRGYFTLDLLTVIPLELIFYPVVHDQMNKSWLSANRIFRILYLFLYYRNDMTSNKLSHHLRWTFLIYLTCFVIQFFTNIWYYVACAEMCTTVKDLSHVFPKFIKAENSYDSIIIAYLNVINTITGSGLRGIRPFTTSEVLITCIVYIGAVFLMSIIASGFAVIQVIDNYSLCAYDYELEEIKTYLQYQGLSPALFGKVWQYYLILWKVQNGEQLPALINVSTRYLKEDIMFDLYCHHLQKHYLFKNTHVDFLRQLMVHLKCCIFPTGYIIVEKGDIDSCMYFIHSGTISVIERRGIYESELSTLQKNESFGEQQGLTCTPHVATYKAKTFVNIVMLNKKDWGYLLKHYPASVEEIIWSSQKKDNINLQELGFP